MKRRTKKKPEWFGVRVDALIRACGWPQSKWRNHFGVGPGAVRRIRDGGCPKIRFVERLQMLESIYAGNLELFSQGLIVTQGRMRYCWFEFPKTVRPEDLREVGRVDSEITAKKHEPSTKRPGSLSRSGVSSAQL